MWTAAPGTNKQIHHNSTNILAALLSSFFLSFIKQTETILRIHSIHHNTMIAGGEIERTD